MIIYDISKNIDGCEVYPGDPMPTIHRMQSLSKGDSCNLSGISMCLHTGTHIDAPSHFLDGGGTIGDAGVEPFIGECHVIPVAHNITGLFIENTVTENMHKVLFKTGGKFYLDKSGANALIETNVKLVGIDALSVSSGYDEASTHRILLQNGIYILEGLNLSEITGRKYFLFAAPINTGSTDGAPCRAVLLQKDDGIVPLPVFGKRRD
ncbi:MAG: cyclase family protein [Clostridia bacterium]|nr:cyclase family protein [Clostridia bacterium]